MVTINNDPVLLILLGVTTFMFLCISVSLIIYPKRMISLLNNLTRRQRDIIKNINQSPGKQTQSAEEEQSLIISTEEEDKYQRLIKYARLMGWLVTIILVLFIMVSTILALIFT